MIVEVLNLKELITMNKTIRTTCEGADTKSIDELIEFQGELKSLSKEDFIKLKHLIVKHGVSFAIQIWVNPDKKYFIIDGHQTIKVLIHLRDKEGYEIPLIPIDYIQAKNKQEAKEKILMRASRFGKIESQGLYQFIIESEIPITEVESNFKLPEIDIPYFKKEYFEDIIDIEAVDYFNEIYNFLIKCENADELKALQNKFKTQGSQVAFAKFIELIEI